MATLQLSPGLTIACSCLFIPASALLTGLRFYTRHRQNATIGTDDWLILPAFLLVVGMQITMIIEISKRMIGYPDPKFVPGKLDATANLPFWPFELQQTLALSFIKLSVVSLYRRIFNTGATPMVNWSTIAMISTISTWAVAFFFSFLFICGKGPANYWTSAKAEKSFCVATQKLHLASAISDAILDILVILMAVPMIWNLHMSTSRKFAVTGIFSLGLITVAASVTRMVIFVQATALRYDPYLDFEYLITASIYWSMIEVGLGYIATNLIVVYGLVAHSSIRLSLRSLRSLLSLPKISRVSSRETDSTVHADEGRMWTKDTGQHSTSAKYVGRDIEEMPLASRGIHLKHEFESTVE